MACLRGFLASGTVLHIQYMHVTYMYIFTYILINATLLTVNICYIL